MSAATTANARHPRKAFGVLLFVEIRERFGYFGMASLLVLYRVERLVLGAVALGQGYGLLSAPPAETFFPAMGLVAPGNGLFKVNPNSPVVARH